MDRGLQWDIFCKVIDNFGDIGISWRLAADLASRGHRVRLWIDDATALEWMAPARPSGLQVLPWRAPFALGEADFGPHPPDVMVEAFGCDIPLPFVAAVTPPGGQDRARPLWINLEYLSAETYVERSHAMPSPVLAGPAAGWTRRFFFPGFTPATGGLLREPGLVGKRTRFDAGAWLAAQGMPQGKEKRVSLFCYEPPALPGLLQQLAAEGLSGEPVRLLVTAGRAARAVQAALPGLGWKEGRGLLSLSFVPLLSQPDYDHLLWTCDLNFVRGEDSVIRAIWAGKPFVWQIYPQDDGVHGEKLDAFLDRLDAPGTLRAAHRAWNMPANTPANVSVKADGPILPLDLAAWQPWAAKTSASLMAQDDLASRLLGFVAKNR